MGGGRLGRLKPLEGLNAIPVLRLVPGTSTVFFFFFNIWQHKDSIHSEKDNSTSSKDFYVDSITPRDMESKERGSTGTRVVKQINGTE